MLRRVVVRRGLRILLAAGLLVGAGSLKGWLEQGREVGGHFPAVVADGHDGAIGLLKVQRDRPGPLRLLGELLTGRPRVASAFVYTPEDMILASDADAAELTGSIRDAAAAAASLLGASGPVRISDAYDPDLVGEEVTAIAGQPASLEAWHQQLDRTLDQVMSSGIHSVREHTTPLTLADGRTVTVSFGSVMIARRAVTTATAAKAGRPGSALNETAYWAVTPNITLTPAPPDDRSARVPPNTEGPSAGLAYALSYLDEATGGELFAGRTVAATGAITPAGQVLPIGGWLPKREAAIAAGADILFVADGSHPGPLQDVRIRIVPVFQLADAVVQLCGRRGGATLTTVCHAAESAVAASAASMHDTLTPARRSTAPQADPSGTGTWHGEVRERAAEDGREPPGSG